MDCIHRTVQKRKGSCMEKTRKTDRRTIYTRNIIKDALLELTKEKTYDTVNVSQLCRQAEIARATFYLHYDSLDEVLDCIIDDALEFSENSSDSLVDVLDLYHNRKNSPSAASKTILPACQRIADSDKYHHLFMDASIGNRIIHRIALHERDKVIPDFMERADLSEDEADMMFRFILHGTFAVNRSLEWQKNARWYHYQRVLSEIISAGLIYHKADLSNGS